MKILKHILGKKARMYHIYTDSTPGYANGSAGIEFFNGNIVMIIRMSTCIPVGGTPHFDFRFYNHITPHMNCSVCKIGKISLDEFGKDNLIKIKTNVIDGILPNSDKNPFRGYEDPRLITWNGELYTYGTQFTDNYNVAQGIMCYKLDENLTKATEISEIPGAWKFYGNEYMCTEKNWMAIPDQKKDFVYALVRKDEDIAPIKYSDLSDHGARFGGITPGQISFRGSTPLIKYKDGYVCIVHNSVRNSSGELDYSHNLCFIDKNFNTAKISGEFRFEQSGIEFSIGWCEDNKKNLYISYSTTDGTTNVIVTTMKDLISVIMNDKEYGEIKDDSRTIADKLYITNPIDASQYYWKDWIQSGNKDSLYSHYAILLHYLDRYLLPDTLKGLESDNSIDAMVLKIYHHRRVSRDFNIFYDMLRSLPENWKKLIQNKCIKDFNFEKLII